MRRPEAVRAIVLATLTACFCAGSALAQTPAASGDALARIRASGVLRVGTTGDYKPFTYRDPATGTYAGMDIDAAEAFARSIGVKVAFVPTSWPTMTADLLADKFDLAMGGISELPARAKVGLLSHSYLADGKRPLVRAADRDRFRTFGDIDRPGIKIATNPGGTNQKFDAEHVKNATVVVVEKNLSIPAMIESGQVDAMITDGVEADYDAAHDPKLYAVDPAHPYTHDRKVYFLQADDATLLAALDAFIDRSLADGTYAALRAKWIGPATAST